MTAIPASAQRATTPPRRARSSYGLSATWTAAIGSRRARPHGRCRTRSRPPPPARNRRQSELLVAVLVGRQARTAETDAQLRGVEPATTRERRGSADPTDFTAPSAAHELLTVP